jgi:fibronectin type 3 domain-containing protein
VEKPRFENQTLYEGHSVRFRAITKTQNCVTSVINFYKKKFVFEKGSIMCVKYRHFFLLFFAALSPLVASSATAGTNEGFVARIDGRVDIRNPEIGDYIHVPIWVEGVVQAKGGLVTAHYNPNLLEFSEFSPGPFIKGMLTLPADPKPQDDGFNTVQGGGTQLSGTPASTSGLLGTMSFKLIADLPVAGAYISIIDVQVQESASNKDNYIRPIRQFGIKLLTVFPNAIFDLETIRDHNSATLNWRTKEPGLNDTVQFRAKGDTTWRTLTNPLAERTTPRMLTALRALVQRGIIPRETPDDARIREALLTVPAFEVPPGFVDSVLTPAFINSIRVLDDALGNRRHVVEINSLELNTEYEFTARSYDLNDRPSQKFTGMFNTRREVDKRPLVVERFEVQSTPVSAVIRWFTNRPADTRLLVLSGVGGFAPSIADEDGTQVHIVEISDLKPETRYEISVGSRLTNAKTFITEGLTEADVQIIRPGIFHTRPAGRRLRFLGPPFHIVGADGARLRINLNQPAAVRVEYAELDESILLRNISTSYTDTTSSEELLTQHDIALSDLSSSTHYRYLITAFNETDTLTTDPRRNEQWSRDLNFRTSADSDTLDPVIVEGPQVIARGKVATVHWTTDIATTGNVYIGTIGPNGTLGTSDEFKFNDLTSNGSTRFARRHIVTVTGLTIGTQYGYRIEAKSSNGKIVAFDPNNSSVAKRAKVLQPPGGSGNFTTDSTADTQFPVILSGPSISSQTHDTAVIEWTTDEPADSDVQFGTRDLGNSETSGDSETSHKIVLSNLDVGTTYNYMIGSTDAAGNGATASSVATFTTNPEIDITAPAITVAPQIVYKNDESATIRWTTDEESTAEVEFGTSTSLGTVRTLSTTDETHQVTLTNLSAATTYYYTVASTDLSSNGPTQSDTLSFKTDTNPDLTSPVISSIQKVVSDSVAIIGWTTDESADSFVEFGTDQTSLAFNIGNTEDVTSHAITLTNLTPGTTYYYIVGSTDPAGNPPTESDTLDFVTLSAADTTAPAIPSNIKATEGARQVLLSWDAVVELDLNGFSIYRSKASDAFSLLSSGIQKTTFTDLNAGNDTTYQYYITASDRQTPANESAASDTVSATPTSSSAPSTPSELGRIGDFLTPAFFFTNASPFQTGATLTYTIQISTEADFSNVTASFSGLAENAGEIGTGQTGWTIDRELEEGASYYWRVRAVEGSLTGPFSDSQQFSAIDPSSLAGDFNGDGAVNFDDFFLFVDFFGQPAEGDAVAYDLDGGGTVDFNDFFTFVDNFGKTISGKRWATARAVDENAIFSIEARGGTRAEDNKLTARLWANQVEDLKAYGAVVQYNPATLRFEGAQPGPGHLLESRGGQAPLFSVFSEKPGQIIIGNGLVEGQEVSGRGLLAELTFTRIGNANAASLDLIEAYTASPTRGVRTVAQLNSTILRPDTYALYANFPNPFNPSTSIEYALPEAASVSIAIYDILGQKVRELAAHPLQPAGFYQLTWDGLDHRGQGVASGIYFYRLKTPGFSQTRKMTLVK